MNNLRKRIRPMLLTALATILAGGLVGCGGNATDLPGLIAAHKKITSYKVQFNASGAPSMTQVAKLKDGQMLKMKMATPMGASIMDFENKVNYMIMGSNVMKMPFDKDTIEDMGDMSPAAFSGGETKVLRNEKLGEVECVVIEFTEDKEKGTVWIGAADGLPRMSTQGNEKTEFTYTEINAVKDSEFELPKGGEVKDMSQMMGAMQKMMSK